MKKSVLYPSTVATKRIEFKDEDGNVKPDFLDVTYAVIPRPYSQIKAFIGMTRDAQETVKAQANTNKRLAVKTQELAGAETDEQKEGIQKKIDSLNADLAAINEKVKDFVAPFADYLIISDDSPRKVLLDWDLLDDNDEKLPVTRAELEDLPAETILHIASELMNEGQVGE